MPSIRKTILKDAALYSSGMYISQLLNMIRGIIVAKMLGPSLLGSWSAVRLIFSYGGSVHLGTIHGMSKLVPYLRGKGDFIEAEELKDTSFFTTLLASSCYIIIIAVIDSLGLFGGSRVEKVGIIIMALGVLIYQYFNFHLAVIRIKHDFKLASQSRVLYSLLNTILSIFLVYMYGLYGAFASFLISILACAYYVNRYTPERFGLKFRPQKIIRLIKTGIPIELVGMVYMIFMTADKLMILKYLTKTELGLYNLALTFNLIIYFVPTAISQVIYPRILEKYGENNKHNDLIKYFTQPTLVIAYLIPMLIGIIYLSCRLVVEVLLPDYISSLGAVYILLCGSFFLSLVHTTNNYLITKNKEKYILFTQGFSIVITVSLNYIFIKMGLGIIGVAMGTAITYFIYSTILLILVYQDQKLLLKQTVLELGKLYFPFIYLITVVLILNGLSLGTDYTTLIKVVLSLVIFVLSMVPLLLYLNKQIKFMNIIKEMYSR